jgi:hypothetical protein
MPHYSYDFGDFPQGECLDPEKLTARVVADAGITTQLVWVTVDGDAESVWFEFEEELSGGEVTALDAIVAGFECETLEELKTRRIFDLDEATKNYLHSRYPAHDLDFYNGILTDAVASGLANRAAYVGAILAWAMSFSVGYFDPKKAAIAAAETKAAAEAVSFSVEECASIFDATDPGASIGGALAIED